MKVNAHCIELLENALTHMQENISKIPHQSENVKRYNLLIIYVSFFKIYQYKVWNNCQKEYLLGDTLTLCNLPFCRKRRHKKVNWNVYFLLYASSSLPWFIGGIITMNQEFKKLFCQAVQGYYIPMSFDIISAGSMT